MAKNNKDNSAIIDTIVAMDKAGGVTKLLSQLRATSTRENLFPELAKLSVSIHFVYGEQDKLVRPAKIAAIYNEQITSTVIKHCGHMMPLEAPQQLSQQITRFFLEKDKVTS